MMMSMSREVKQTPACGEGATHGRLPEWYSPGVEDCPWIEEFLRRRARRAIVLDNSCGLVEPVTMPPASREWAA